MERWRNMKATCSPVIFNATFYKGRGGPAQALSVVLFTILVIVNAVSVYHFFKFIYQLLHVFFLLRNKKSTCPC